MWLWYYWPAALIVIVLILFAPAEWAAAVDDEGPTFSRFMVRMNRYPIWPFSWGLLIGGLIVHFMLPWCPT